MNFKLKIISHASVFIDLGEVKLLTDPWLFGNCFNDGWSLKKANLSEENITQDEINSITHLYLSHEHPDHFHIPTLKKSFVRNIEDISYDKIKHSLDLLLTSVIIGTREATRIMSKQNNGSIVNTASIAGHWGGCGGSVYSAAKAGVIHFSKVTSLELAKYNIRVNSISPGAIITEIFGVGQKLSGEKLSLSDDHLKSSEAFNDFQPISRAGLPEDIANLAIYLASDESTFVTGQDFVVDGGLLAGRPLNVASESFKKINRSLKSI